MPNDRSHPRGARKGWYGLCDTMVSIYALPLRCEPCSARRRRTVSSPRDCQCCKYLRGGPARLALLRLEIFTHAAFNRKSTWMAS